MIDPDPNHTARNQCSSNPSNPSNWRWNPSTTQIGNSTLIGNSFDFVSFDMQIFDIIFYPNFFTYDGMLWYPWQLPSGRVSFHRFLKRRDAFDGVFGKKITQTPPDYDIRQKTSNSTSSLMTLQVDRYW